MDFRAVVILGSLAAAAAGGAGLSAGPLFLVDDTKVTHVSISWPTKSGKAMTLEGDRSYADPSRREPMGRNLECYVSPGGTRLDVGASDPRGSIIRVGFYKTDGKKAMFDQMAPDSSVTITLKNVVFNQKAIPKPETLIQHAKFDDPNSVLGCNASAGFAAQNSLLDLYNTTDPKDTLGGRVTARNGRPGSLAQKATVTVEKDGSVTMTATIPYALFKHPDDPWLRNNPGDFTEPFHFHIEFEVVPAEGASAIAAPQASRAPPCGSAAGAALTPPRG